MEELETVLRASLCRRVLAANPLLTARLSFWEEDDRVLILMLRVTVDSVEDQLGMGEKRLVSKGKPDCSRITLMRVEIVTEVGPSNACTIGAEFRGLMFDMLWRLYDHPLGIGSALRSHHRSSMAVSGPFAIGLRPPKSILVTVELIQLVTVSSIIDFLTKAPPPE